MIDMNAKICLLFHESITENITVKYEYYEELLTSNYYAKPICLHKFLTLYRDELESQEIQRILFHILEHESFTYKHLK